MNHTTTPSTPQAIDHNGITPSESPQQPSNGAIGQVDAEEVGTNTDGEPERKEHTRSKMAILFILGFFAILFLCFVYAIKVNASLSDLKDTLIGVIGALSGTLGFIVGYYYKATQEQ